MEVNKYCYVEGKDIEVELKANKESNVNCDGCMYIDFCKKDINVKEVEVKEAKAPKEPKKTKEVKTPKEVKEPVESKEPKEVKEKVVKEKVVKEKAKKPTKKKQSLEELAEEDIF